MARSLLTCQEFDAFLTDYWEGELSAEASRRFEEHLAACPPCVDYLEGYRRTAELAARAFAPDAAVPDAVPAKLIRAILDSRRHA